MKTAVREQIKELQEERAGIAHDMRSMLDAAQEEKRSLTAEEEQKFAKMNERCSDIKASIDNMEKVEAVEESLRSTEEKYSKSAGVKAGSQRSDKGTADGERMETVELRESHGWTRSVTCDHNPALRRAFMAFMLRNDDTGLRALQQDVDTQAGYTLAPQLFMAELIQAVDNAVFLRRLARVLPPLTSADSLGAPSLDTDPADPTWTAELGTGDFDSSMAFGKRELKPYPLAEKLKVSKTLLRKGGIDIDALVRERLSYKMGIKQENAFINGTGALQPLGIMTASSLGISTSRDVSSGNTTTSIMFDGLKTAQYTLKQQYRRVASWIFHRDAMAQISKLKDGEGRYIWQPSVVPGDPDRILGRPFYESEYMPNTFTTGQYVGVLGDYRFYWIVDALTLQIQVLLELYAATNQNGYHIRTEVDAMPVLEEAFVRVKLA